MCVGACVCDAVRIYNMQPALRGIRTSKAMKRPAARCEEKIEAEGEQMLGADGDEDLEGEGMQEIDDHEADHEAKGEDANDKDGGPPAKRARKRAERTDEEKEVQATIKTLPLEKYVATRF